MACNDLVSTRGPCAAITPISPKCPRRLLRSCVRRETSTSRALWVHQRRLVLNCSNAHKRHRRPRHCFTDCRRIRRVVLLPTHIGLYISGRHQPRVMAKFDQLARPMMRRAGGLKPNQARRQRGKKCQKIFALHRPGDDHAPRCVNAVDLNDGLRQIETNGGDRRQIATLLHRTALAQVAPIAELHGLAGLPIDL
jgi:hypothetical protein